MQNTTWKRARAGAHALVRLRPGRGALLRAQTYAQTGLPCSDELAGRNLRNFPMRSLQLQTVHRAHQLWLLGNLTGAAACYATLRTEQKNLTGSAACTTPDNR